MKFRQVLFILLFALLTSCESIHIFSNDVQETGAWGPVLLNSDKISGMYFISQVEDPEAKFEVKVIQTDNQLILYPSIPMMIGKTYQLEVEGKSEPVVKKIRVREPCIAYLGGLDGKSEIWKKCSGYDSIQLTKTDGVVEDITVSRLGDWIFFTEISDLQESGIWQVRPDGSGKKKIIECSRSKCSDLDYSPLTGKLVFIQMSKKPHIKIFDLITKIKIEIEGSGTELKFSPDGQYLSYFDNLSGQLTIINISTKNRITKQSGSGLVGDWARDSHAILFGELEYWGGIPGVKIYELDVKSGEMNLILNDPNREIEFYQPMYSRDEGVYLTSIRQRNTGSSKHLWLLREGAEGVKQITNDPLYHYSFPSWNSDYSELVFQRYPINNSDGHPQVVIWNQSSDTFEVIAENASKPFWLP